METSIWLKSIQGHKYSATKGNNFNNTEKGPSSALLALGQGALEAALLNQPGVEREWGFGGGATPALFGLLPGGPFPQACALSDSLSGGGLAGFSRG